MSDQVLNKDKFLSPYLHTNFILYQDVSKINVMIIIIPASNGYHSIRKINMVILEMEKVIINQ